MADQMTPDEIQAAARLAGVKVTDREAASIAQALGGFLQAVRMLPAETVEPLPVFSPGTEGNRGR